MDIMDPIKFPLRRFHVTLPLWPQQHKVKEIIFSAFCKNLNFS